MISVESGLTVLSKKATKSPSSLTRYLQKFQVGFFSFQPFKSLFVKDVETKFVFDPSFFGGETIIIKGIDDYMEYIKASGSLFRSSQHLIGNLLISESGNSVKVKSNLNSRGYYKDDINRSVSLWGYYETYLKKINGHWKIIRHDFYSLGAEE